MTKDAPWLLVVLAASACGGKSVTYIYETVVDPDAASEPRDAATEDATGLDSGADVALNVGEEAPAEAAADVSADVGADVTADVVADVLADVSADAQEAGVIPTGQPCAADYACVSSACDSVTLTCVASQCDDRRLDGAETDVDCGGPACPVCATGQVCKVDDDCSTSACDVFMHVCISNACEDHTKDNAETDVDCGGSTCRACALGKGCSVPSDCSSVVCDTLTYICISSQCNDHTQDGSETDVDCGGSCCTAGSTGCCVPGAHCATNFDCVSGHFCNASKVCQ